MKYIFYLLLLLFNFGFSRAVTQIKGIAYLYEIKIDVFSNLVKEYNKYSEKNNLDISLEVELFTSANSTVYLDFGSFLESIFKNKSVRNKYDLIFYFDTYTHTFGSHFINLEKYLPPEKIDVFERSIIDTSCLYDNKIVGLPVFFDTNVLYSNLILLKKYEKEIPKTWDQLIDTAMYIRDQERDLYNNTDFDPFHGIFSRSSEGGLSFFEVIASCRESNVAQFPDEASTEYKEGVEMIKRIRDSLYDSNELFESNMNYAISKFYAGQVLFIKFYMGSYPPIYEPSIVPGKKEGVAGTLPASFVISVNRYIDNDETREAALNVLEFFTSKNTQKEFILKKNVLSAMKNLYYDPEICANFKCDVFLKSRPFTKLATSYRKFNYEKYWYSERVRGYIADYLSNNASLDSVMKNIINLSKTYYLLVDAKESLTGLVVFIIYITLVSLIAISLIIISTPLRKYKCFLPYDFWLISILGTIVIMSSIFTMYGPLSSTKCHMRIFLASIGLSMTILPIISQLITNFPSVNKVSSWFENTVNRYIFFVSSMLIIIIFNSLLFITPYTINNVVNKEKEGNENFQECSMKSGFGKFSLILLILLKAFMFFSIFILTFLEWNIKETAGEMKGISSLLFVEVLAVIMSATFSLCHFKTYIVYVSLYCSIFIVFSFSSLVCVYIIELIPVIKNNKKESIEDMIKKLRENNEMFTDSVSKSSAIKSNDECANTFGRESNQNESNAISKTLNSESSGSSEEIITTALPCLTISFIMQ